MRGKICAKFIGDMVDNLVLRSSLTVISFRLQILALPDTAHSFWFGWLRFLKT